jgi:3-oxoacyl-[acyl-carrier protein] reductase
MRFQNKTVIITGAASGMGLDAAQAFAREGANVVLTDANAEAAKAATTGITENGGTALAIQTDVRFYDQVQRAVDTTLETYGRVDIMYNCAGGSAGRIFGRTEEFHEHPLEVIDFGIDVNLKGPVYFARAVLAPMIAQGSGVIISLASVDGVAGSRAVEYSAAKGGVIAMTKSLAVYGAAHGIRACCVSPGPVLTRPTMAKLKTRLGRAAQPEEITKLVLYLASDDASFITGTNYIIDGGRTIGMP